MYFMLTTYGIGHKNVIFGHKGLLTFAKFNGKIYAIKLVKISLKS
jgi:hypothetical protein